MDAEKPDLSVVLEHYARQEGRDLDMSRAPEHGNYKIKCPFHDDRHPSASVNMTTGRFRCFACNAPSGDSIDIIRGMEGVEFLDAIRWAESHIGYQGSEVRAAPAHRQYRPSWLAEEDD